MAITRNMLKAMGIDEEKASEIIAAYLEATDAIKKERDAYKAQAEKLPEALKQLEEAREAAKHSGDYDKLKKEFDDYKAEVAEREVITAKKAALEKVAKDAGLTAAGIAKVLKYTDLSGIELDAKGDVKDGKGLIKSLREEWPEHIQTRRTVGADTPTPPANDGSKPVKTKDEILAIKDTAERQAAWREYLAAQQQKG